MFCSTKTAEDDPAMWTFPKLTVLLVTFGQCFHPEMPTLPDEVEPGGHPWDGVPHHVHQVHLQTKPGPVRIVHVPHIDRIFFQRSQIFHQLKFFFRTPELIPYVLGAGQREGEVVAEGEGLDEHVHGGGAALGHPVVDQHKVTASPVQCCCNNVFFFCLGLLPIFRRNIIKIASPAYSLPEFQ